jgi:hypothetical protein
MTFNKKDYVKSYKELFIEEFKAKLDEIINEQKEKDEKEQN